MWVKPDVFNIQTMSESKAIRAMNAAHLESLNADVMEFGKIRISKEKDSMRITFFMEREGGMREEIYIDVPEGIVEEFSNAVIKSWAKFYLRKNIKITVAK